ncbi:MAG: hypothetical protein ACK4PN_00315 [Allorhizobium sp.]
MAPILHPSIELALNRAFTFGSSAKTALEFEIAASHLISVVAIKGSQSIPSPPDTGRRMKNRKPSLQGGHHASR